MKPQGKKTNVVSTSAFAEEEGFPAPPLPSLAHNKTELFPPLEALLAANAEAEELRHQLPKIMLPPKLSLTWHTCLLYIPI